MALKPVTIKPVTGEAPALLKQAIEYYKPGGEFAGIRGEQLEAKKGTYTAAAESQLVGRGLAGTTVGAAIPGAFEQEVATPWRTETEMFRGARLMEAVLGQAGFAERQTAREQEVAIANAQMILEQRLRNREISVQEYNAASARIAARKSGGGSAAGVGPEAGGYGGPEVGGAPAAGGGAGYGQHLLDSLEYGHGTQEYEQAGTGYNPYTYGEGGEYRGGLSTEAAQKESQMWQGSLAGIAEQWLTEPSEANPLGYNPDTYGEGETGAGDRKAYEAAKAAGTPWTYNYGTWLAAKGSGKI